ncbi:DUF1501 domain-containing protein [Erythrobacter insulae]|uniref:DUF1501 domain-containing protein n=1 Tax=Erythrobacter insulae TaxID=2584124 RepID=A0A547PCQ4_9SPHN|nr:DUF1501 domain-containing protein [Erythrobacter insulae]TRD11921.1 DUF1501 domain-containing protein [Erythrobacter insulae]
MSIIRQNSSVSRRRLLKGMAVGGIGGFGLPSAMSSDLAAAESDDYRAIVCIFLEGGSDNWNTLVPFDRISHGNYFSARPNIAFSQANLNATHLKQSNDLGGYSYALNPSMRPLLEVFDAGDLAVLQNIGALMAPTSAAMFMNESGLLPSRLFSHNTQSDFVLTGEDGGGATGWGGRIADQLVGYNAYREFTCINAAAASSPFLSGRTLTPYAIDENGAKLIFGGREDATTALLRTVTTAVSNNVFRNEYAKIMRRALYAGNLFASVFSQIPESDLADLPTNNNELGRQMKAIAKTIAGARVMGMRRQVFFAKLPNWDAHSTTDESNNNSKRLADAMHGFWRVMERWGIGSSVTTFTVSDFGRTLTSNGSGTNHGWGSAQFVMGGAVAGGKILGKPPVVGVGSPDSVLGGRLVPSTPIDSLAATLAAWMGVSETGLVGIAPNLSRFDPSVRVLDLFGTVRPNGPN